MWDGFQYRKLIDGNQAVLIPVHRKGVYIKVGDNKVMSYGFLNYTMMYKDSTNNIVTETVSLRPSIEWFEKKDRNKYDGTILVKYWEGRTKAIYYFKDGVLVSNKNKHNKVANSNAIDTKNDSEDAPCLITTTYTLKPATCPCMGHTYAQRENCTCHTKPSNEYGVLETTIEIDCSTEEPPIDPPTRTSREDGEYSQSWTSGGESGSLSNNYTPQNCRPDDQPIDYSIPLKPGEGYAIFMFTNVTFSNRIRRYS